MMLEEGHPPSPTLIPAQPNKARVMKGAGVKVHNWGSLADRSGTFASPVAGPCLL